MKNLFNFKHLKGDFLGGLTAGVVALPLALAFGVSSGMGPSAGLYGAIFISFFAALFGGTPTQISGPTAPMTAVSIVIISGIVGAFEGSLDRALPAILTVFILAGIFQIVLGSIGIGKYIKYIPYPVVSGFMTAIGVMILFTQIGPALGYSPTEDAEYVNTFKAEAEHVILNNILADEENEGILVLENFTQTHARADTISKEHILVESKSMAAKSVKDVVGSITTFPRAVKNMKWLELILALGTIFIIFGFKRITDKIPSTLVALFVMSGIAVGFGLEYNTIQEIPSGLPLPHWEIFSDFSFGSVQPYIFTALSLALLGAIDSLLTSVVADNMTKTKHNPNKELIGQGIGNTIGGLFGGLPGAGATIRTVVNIKAGGKTRLSGMVAGVILLLVMLTLGPIASKIPAAVLAGILITVGIGVMDYKGLKAIPNTPRTEVAIMLTVLFLSVTWDLVYAVGIGLVIASIMFMKKMGDLTSDASRVYPLKDEEKWADELDFPDKLKEEVFIKHMAGPLFFGSTSEFQMLIKQIPSTANTIIIRMDKMRYLDQSGLFVIEDIFIDMIKEGKNILLVHLPAQPKSLMEKVSMIPDLIPEEHIFDDFRKCLVWVKENVKDEH